MKVFISWSGEHSKKLGEALKEWLPGVLQRVQPYFTPSDIEKGARWASEIAAELSNAQVGILCITRDNLHSDWVMFEAGALSKSLEKSHVCPILFGISNADLAGPLKQFQTTEFNRGEMHKLMATVNGRLGESKLPQKTFDGVFDMWWPTLEQKVGEIMQEINGPQEPIRSEREILEEILLLARSTAKNQSRPSRISTRAIQDLLQTFIDFHDEQASETGGYAESLESLKRMSRPIEYIASTASHTQAVAELLKKFNELTFEVMNSNPPQYSFDPSEEPPF
jgi:hypothetical protein